jgi:hypothetical protein
MPHCDPETLALAALGEQIEPAQAAHLEGCERCLAEAAELIELVTLGREAPRELPEVPAAVWAGIRAELALGDAPDGDDRGRLLTLPAPVAPAPPAAPRPQAPAATNVVPLAPRRSRLFAVAGIAAAAGALVGGAVVWSAVDQGGTSTPTGSDEVLVAQAVLAPLEPDVPRAGQAQVLDSPDGEVVRVDATALPQRDGFYQVWLIDSDVQKMVAIGALPAGAIGTFTVPPGVSIEDYPVVDISLEPLDGNPAHSKQSLMRGVLDA